MPSESIKTASQACSVSPAEAQTALSADSTPVLSWKEVASHCTIDDAWIVIKGRVYDVTKFGAVHPAGDILYTAAGQDATDVFAAFHQGTAAWRALPPLCVGVVEGPPPCQPGVTEDYVRDVLEMRRTMQEMRMFESSKLYYASKFLSTVAILICALTILRLFEHSTVAVITSAIMLALFWQQCGWLAHDSLHHQIFANRVFNNIGGLLVGNLFQGFSVAWWKAKHNHHHAVPNVTDTPSGGDPDIATMPILFWSEKLISGEDLHALPRWMLANQAVLYWPVLCMARLSWLLQSFQHQFLPRRRHVTSNRMFTAEVTLLVVHHLLYFSMVHTIPSRIHRVIFMIVSQALGGLFIGVVFTVGHNAMDVLTEKELRETDFVRLQVRTTRDVNPHWFTDWFCGGLNYQIEHHIWPTIPRHHLPKAAVILRSFCEKYDIPYTSETLIDGNRSVCRLLESVSSLVHKY